MKTRTFLKSLCASVSILPFFDKKAQATTIIPKVKLPPDTLEKFIEFEDCGIDYRLMITKNLLIPVRLDDGTAGFDLNIYGDYYAIIGTARLGPINGGPSITKHIRFESKHYLRGEVLLNWDKEVTECIKLAKSKLYNI